MNKSITCVSALAIAAVRFDLIDAGGVIDTFVIQTVIDVSLATIPLVTGRAVATKLIKSKHITKNCELYVNRRRSSIPETPFFQNFAYGRVAARIAVTSVNGGFAQLSVIAGGAKALVIPLARRPTSCAVLTGESITSVALGQYLVGNFSYWGKQKILK